MCTALMITDANGLCYSGKTMELSDPLPFAMSYMPAGTKVLSLARDGTDGAAFTTKYAILGASLPPSFLPGSHQLGMTEAVNDQGLSVNTNTLNDSRTPDDIGTDTSRQIASTDLASWVLGNFKTVAEAKAALDAGAVKVWLPKLAFVGGIEMPMHFIFFDRSGAGIVVEFLDGHMRVHDNPVGVVTNGPEFPWHLKNLKNYAFLNNQDRNEGKFGTFKVTAEDSGNALAGLPSTQTSAGRFVKAAYYTTYVRKAKNPDQAIVTLAHVLNNFDRPYDLSSDTVPVAASSGTRWDTSSEVSVFTWMNDKSRNLYFLRTIDAINFARFEMDRLAPIKKVVTVPFSQITDSTLDGTALLLTAAGN